MDRLSCYYEKNKKWLYTALIYTFLWGILAHGYCFLDNSFSHDSLLEMNGDTYSHMHKLELGRVFIPLYHRLLRGNVTLPWLVGCVSLAWIGLSVFCVNRIFKIESKALTFAVAGVFATNITVSATAASYLHDFDCNMFALLCAALAAYLWREWKWGFVLGAVPVCLSLGIYQSYVFVAVALVMIACILDLLNGDTALAVLCRGLKAIGMLALGAVAYILAMKGIMGHYQVPMTQGHTSSLYTMTEVNGSNIAALVAGAYASWFKQLLHLFTMTPFTVHRLITYFLFAVSGAAIVLGLCSKKLGLWEKLMCAALVLLLPLGMNMIYVLTITEIHELMLYAVWLFYLAALLLSDWLWKRLGGCSWTALAGKYQRALCIALVAVLMYGNVSYANGMYLKKDMEYDAYLSMMTRVVARMESEEDYVPGQTPVIFYGTPSADGAMNPTAPGFEQYVYVSGMWSSDVVAGMELGRYQSYFDNVLCMPILLAEGSLWKQARADEALAALPNYPDAGCMVYWNGVLVVKLGGL